MNKPDETEIEANENNEKECSQKRCHDKRYCGVGRFIVGALVIVGVVAIASAIFGGKDCHTGSHHWKESNMSERLDHMSKRMLDKIDATDTQKEQIDVILNKYKPELESVHSERKVYKDTLMTALKQESVNPAQLEQIRQKIQSGFNEKSVVITNMIGEVANVLNAEQRVELLDTFERHHHR